MKGRKRISLFWGENDRKQVSMVDARHHGFPAGSLIIYNKRGKISVQDDKIIKFGIG